MESPRKPKNKHVCVCVCVCVLKCSYFHINLSMYVTAMYILGKKTQHTIGCSNESKARQNPDESHFCIGLPHQLSEVYIADLLLRLQILQHA